MGSNATDPLILPIAHYIGEQYNSETKSSTFDLRGGWGIAEVNPTERLVWATAHGLPEQLARGKRWTRTALVEAVGPTIGDSTSRIIDELLERDILAEVQPGSRQAAEFARGVRLVPLRLGIGNSAEDPTTWRIGSDMDSPMIGVSHTVYNMWTWSHLYKNLWESCQSLANIRSKGDKAVPANEGERDPEVILYEVLEGVHTLLASASAYFDVTVDWGTV